MFVKYFFLKVNKIFYLDIKVKISLKFYKRNQYIIILKSVLNKKINFYQKMV